jgi:hypothetical protein
MIFPTGLPWLRVLARVCTYRCGECDYLKTDHWVNHQTHYEEHVRNRNAH